jgi:hypothetical protein
MCAEYLCICYLQAWSIKPPHTIIKVFSVKFFFFWPDTKDPVVKSKVPRKNEARESEQKVPESLNDLMKQDHPLALSYPQCTGDVSKQHN